MFQIHWFEREMVTCAPCIKDREVSSPRGQAEVRRGPQRRRAWTVGGWKMHDVAVAVAVGLSCALAVSAVLVPIIAPHVFDGTIQGTGGVKSAAAGARERHEWQQRTMVGGVVGWWHVLTAEVKRPAE